MGFLIKHIDNERATEFFTNAYTTIFSKKESERHKEQLALIKEELPLFLDVTQSSFDKNITAVNLVWLDIAWTKYCMGQRISTGKLNRISKVIDFTLGPKRDIEAKFPKLNSYSELYDLYNQAFGSSNTDGNTVMAQEFLNQIIDNFNRKTELSAEDVEEIISIFSAQFAGIYDTSLQNIKSYAPVH